MDLCIALKNLYTDREITGELLVHPFKRYSRLLDENIQGNAPFSEEAYLAGKIALHLILGPLALVGMAIKCLHVHEVTRYNERIRQALIERQTWIEYPHQPDTVYYLLITPSTTPFDERNAVLSRLTQADKMWERFVCNILGYQGENGVFIQAIARFPRWAIPEGVVRPFGD